MIGTVEMAVRLARVSRELLGLSDDETTLRSVVTKAVEIVDACDFAVVSERAGSTISPRMATAGIVEECELLQARRLEGPSVEVMWDTEVSLVRDTAREARWPSWGRRASELGMSSVLAVRLHAGNHPPSSLTLYSTKTDAFSTAEIATAFSYATHAAVALFAARQAKGFSQAIDTRHTIGVAQGILMARYGIDKEHAFDLLRRYSNTSNTKLRDVARSVVDNGALLRDRIPQQSR